MRQKEEGDNRRSKNVKKISWTGAMLFVAAIILNTTVMMAPVKVHAAETSIPKPVEVWYCGPSTSNHAASYYEDEKGVLCSDGEVWDNCILVGPEVQGERIYIPENLLSAGSLSASKRHWFFRDTCSRIESPVYVLRTAGTGSYQAYSYDPKESEVTRVIRKEEPRGYDRQFYVIAPKMEGSKVILENYSGDGRTYYIPRAEMVWVNPPTDPPSS